MSQVNASVILGTQEVAVKLVRTDNVTKCAVEGSIICRPSPL